MSIECEVNENEMTRGTHKGKFEGYFSFDDYPNPRIFLNFVTSEQLSEEARRVIRQIAIEMFEHGVKHGESLKSEEICNALGIKRNND